MPSENLDDSLHLPELVRADARIEVESFRALWGGRLHRIPARTAVPEAWQMDSHRIEAEDAGAGSIPFACT
jgi:hypothetical protein